MALKTDITHTSLHPTELTAVADAMHAGIFACPPETPVRIVARMMAAQRIHSVAVMGDPRNFADERLWRLVSDRDVVRAVGPELIASTAGDVATEEIRTVAPTATLAQAAELMDGYGVAHLVVVDPDIDHPVGMLSSLDIATAACRR